MYIVYDPVEKREVDGPFPTLGGAVSAAARFRLANKGHNLQVKEGKNVVATIFIRDGDVYSLVPNFQLMPEFLNQTEEINWNKVQWEQDVDFRDPFGIHKTTRMFRLKPAEIDIIREALKFALKDLGEDSEIQALIEKFD